MKTLYSSFAGLLLLVGVQTHAQSALTTDIESQITSAESLPVLGVRYYYYPNLDAYFDTQENLYIFEKNGQFVKEKEVPSGYRGYSLYNGVRVAITDYDGDKPQTLLAEHRKTYPKKYTSRRQPPKPKAEEKLALK